MEPQHHNKLMIVIIVLIVVIVLGLGIAAIFGWNKKPAPAPVVDMRTEEQKIIDSTTATRSSSMDDPEVKMVNESTSAKKPATASARERAALIESMSAVEI